LGFAGFGDLDELRRETDGEPICDPVGERTHQKRSRILRSMVPHPGSLYLDDP